MFPSFFQASSLILLSQKKIQNNIMRDFPNT